MNDQGCNSYKEMKRKMNRERKLYLICTCIRVYITLLRTVLIGHTQTCTFLGYTYIFTSNFCMTLPHFYHTFNMFNTLYSFFFKNNYIIYIIYILHSTLVQHNIGNCHYTCSFFGCSLAHIISRMGI